MIGTYGVKQLFNAGKVKFTRLAQETNYKGFIEYLEQQPNFKIIHNMTEKEKQQLYELARGNNDK